MTIDSVRHLRDLTQTLKEKGGYGVTHVGDLRRKDGEGFAWSATKQAIDVLRFWFTFSRGSWVGPAFPEGHHDGRVRVKEHSNHILSPWADQRSWFPRLPTAPDDGTLERFYQLWVQEDWADPLRHMVWWYVEAINAPTADSRVVLIHSALELIAWLHVVESRRLVSAESFHRLRLADKLRMLIVDLGIPPDVPHSFSRLVEAAAAENWEGGPEAFYGVRNALVHPSPSNRDRHSRVGYAVFEAGELGCYYAEMSLLAILGYTGTVRSRLQLTGWAEEAAVPWAMD